MLRTLGDMCLIINLSDSACLIVNFMCFLHATLGDLLCLMNNLSDSACLMINSTTCDN